MSKEDKEKIQKEQNEHLERFIALLRKGDKQRKEVADLKEQLNDDDV